MNNARRMGHNSPIVRSGENLFFAYGLKTGEGRFAVMVATSGDAGRAWSHQAVAEQAFFVGQCLSPMEIFPAIAADENGAVHVAWSLHNPETQRVDLFFASSPDLGKTWGDALMMVDRPGQRKLPWIDTDANGTVGLAWYETNASGLTTRDEIQCLDSTPDEAEWFVHLARISDPLGRAEIQETRAVTEIIDVGSLGGTGEFLSFAFDSHGQAGLAYMALGKDGEYHPMYVRERP